MTAAHRNRSTYSSAPKFEIDTDPPGGAGYEVRTLLVL